MNCDEANFLISARIDGDVSAGPAAALDAHLAECEACRLVLTEMELQDGALMRAFIPHREAAYELADRVLETIAREHADSRIETLCFARGHDLGPSGFGAGMISKCLKLVAGWTAAAALGFIAAMVVTRFAKPRPAPQYVISTVIPLHDMQPPVAKLTLATGQVFTCPSSETAWRPISPSDPVGLYAGLRTADAKCELRLPDGSCVRLNSGTEARFTSGRTLSVTTGEVWSSVPRDGVSLSISAGRSHVTASGAGGDRGTKFDLARSADAATVMVSCGAADVAGNGQPTTVHAGQILRAPSPPGVFVCTAVPDPLLASRWQDDLLVLKPGDDPEVAARVDQLLAAIAIDSATSESPGTTEEDVRARGQAWCTPLACYLHGQPSAAENRRTAARLLADLAPPSIIPDLIGLLRDADGQVRYHAAFALHRLTGQTLGFPPDRFAAARDPGAIDAWRKWWEQNQARH